MERVPDISAEIAQIEEEMDDDTESIITNERYVYISSIIGDCYTKKQNGENLTVSDKIDRIVTNRFLALPIFAVVMYIVYYVSVTTVGTFMTDWTNDVLFGEIIPPAVESVLVAVNCADWLQGLILDGIVAGVGAVLGFVPQMLVLFIFLAFLESLRVYGKGGVYYGQDLPQIRAFRQVLYPYADRLWLRGSGNYGLPYH